MPVATSCLVSPVARSIVSTASATRGSRPTSLRTVDHGPVRIQNACSSHKNQTGRTWGPCVAKWAVRGRARNSSTSPSVESIAATVFRHISRGRGESTTHRRLQETVSRALRASLTNIALGLHETSRRGPPRDSASSSQPQKRSRHNDLVSIQCKELRRSTGSRET